MPHTPDQPTAPAAAALNANAAAQPSETPLLAVDAPLDTHPAAHDEPVAVVAAEPVPDMQADSATADAAVAPVAAEHPSAADATPALPKPADLSPSACAELLKQHFPALFGGPAKPLKLRIQADIQTRAPGVFSKGSLSAFFRRYTGGTGYLIALGKATERFDLDGLAAGELTEEHRQLARDELTRRRQVTREREQQAHALQHAAQHAAHTAAHTAAQQLERQAERMARQAEQAQQAEVNQARQTRLALLRDFERTTLTMANFCALKGLTVEALQPVLAQARKEAAEAPPPRPMDDPRSPRRPDHRPDHRDHRDHRDGRPQGPRPDRDSRPPQGPRRDGDAGPQGPRREGDARPPGPRGDGDARPQGQRAEGDARPQGPRVENETRPQGPRPAGRPGGRPNR